jgi:hypothetical protein
MPPGSVRRSQLISTYGVGAIIAFEDESFMVCGTDRWDVEQSDLHEPRLERDLNVSGFATPPVGRGSRDVPVVRFPRWHSCPGCERLDDHRFFAGLHDNTCQSCNRVLVPSRFVIACPKGHIEDFPYFSWIHAGLGRSTGQHEMKISSSGETASLASVEVSCSCGAKRTMEGAFDRVELRKVARCRGRRPWLTSDADECSEDVRTLQRGASNVWFATLASALSIPPWSEGAHQALNRFWAVLRHVGDDALPQTIEGMGIASGTDYSVEDLVVAVKERRGTEQTPSDDGGLQLRLQEFDALRRGKEERSRGQEFVVETGQVPPDLASRLDQVMLAKRLREVRALTGFTRLTPSHDPERIAPLAVERPAWGLPAIEVKGEGVFMSFSSDAIGEWEARPEVRERAAVVDERYQRQASFWAAENERRITPRLLMVHTFAHALINQWALDAGYPAASLRERLFVSDDVAGLLIYTATSDAAGSLGGVISQAAPERLGPAVEEALGRYAWCSADPVCIETEAAGVDSLNLAACHACALLPETSCEERNTLLDRGLLIGTPKQPDLGFFADLVDH